MKYLYKMHKLDLLSYLHVYAIHMGPLLLNMKSINILLIIFIAKGNLKYKYFAEHFM